MRAIVRILVLFALSLILVACEGSSGKSKDKIAPVITLMGSNPQVIEAGNAYVEFGATATDNRDGDLSNAIVIDASQVDASVPDTYVVTYRVSDAAGNSGTASRTVVIEDTTPPVITLLGDDPQVVIAGNSYVELGASASDTLDGDLSVQIVINATAVDTMGEGVYTVTYDVTDAAGNAAVTVIRTVRVELPPPPSTPTVSVDSDTKQLIFTWDDIADADYYRLMENPDGHSGFTQIGGDLPAGTLTVAREISVHLHDWVNVQYVLQACNLGGCNVSPQVSVQDHMLDSIGYFKASNPDIWDMFGTVALSADGETLVVGAAFEDSGATGVNGDEDDNSSFDSGAVYVFRKDADRWYQQAYLKPLNRAEYMHFGWDVALSADGTTLAIGALEECGAYAEVYIFRFDGSDWVQTTVVATAWDEFAYAECNYWRLDVALSSDGNTLAIGAPFESAHRGDINYPYFGAAYVYRFNGIDWTQERRIENPIIPWPFRWGEPHFGHAVALCEDGTLLAIGHPGDGSGSTGINGEMEDQSAPASGAVHVYGFDGADWLYETFIKPSDTEEFASFGGSVGLSSDGRILAVGTAYSSSVYVYEYSDIEWSEQTTFEACSYNLVLSSNGGLIATCGANLFGFDGANWMQVGSVIQPNGDDGDNFGTQGTGRYPHNAIALSADGTTLAVGAMDEDGGSGSINGDQTDNSVSGSGAVYVY